MAHNYVNNISKHHVIMDEMLINLMIHAGAHNAPLPLQLSFLQQSLLSQIYMNLYVVMHLIHERSSYGSGIWEFPLSLKHCYVGSKWEHAPPSRGVAQRRGCSSQYRCNTDRNISGSNQTVICFRMLITFELNLS
jgi:hypothetical protein